jgi:uncharacterized membrane protein YeaQ/YmgE (transglycosylase-associated protein family)
MRSASATHPGHRIVGSRMLGILGAIVGGLLFSLIGGVGVTGLNLYSLMVAIVGAVVVLWVYHALIGPRSS